MFVISFANPKGGSGKTTSALLLAEQIHHAGARVAVLDCDPCHHIVQWGEKRTKAGRGVPFLIEQCNAEEAFLDAVEDLQSKADYLIIDMEGTASNLMTYAISRSDLVLIPFECTPMEASQAARATQLVKQTCKLLTREIDYALLFTRINAAMQTKEEKEVRKQTANVPQLSTGLVRRAPYTKIFANGDLLSELKAAADKEAEGRSEAQQTRLLKPLESAIANAKAFAQEVVNYSSKMENAA